MDLVKSYILVTGGAGNIGSYLCRKLSEDSETGIVIFDNLVTGSKDKIVNAQNVVFERGDVNNKEELKRVFKKYKFDLVFHFAALVGVQRTLENPLSVLEDIEGIKNVLSLSNEHKITRVFFSSSSEVYGEPFEIPQNEKTTPLNSYLPYAVVKNVGEAYFRSYKKEYDLDYTIFRFFNTYGPNQSLDFVIPKFFNAAIKNEDLIIYGDGSQTRSFCWIEDNVDTCIKSITDISTINTVINVGSDLEISIQFLAQKIIDITGSSSEIKNVPRLKEGDMTRRCPDITVMKRILGREPLGLEEGLIRYFKWYEGRSKSK